MSKKVLLALAVILEMLSIALFLMGSETAIAASVQVIGLTVLIVALSGDRTRARR
jgi:hypothetical protein